jgi:hypothetical protein
MDIHAKFGTLKRVEFMCPRTKTVSPSNFFYLKTKRLSKDKINRQNTNDSTSQILQQANPGTRVDGDTLVKKQTLTPT